MAELEIIPWQIFFILVVACGCCVTYSFKTWDKAFYTDVLCSFLAFILSGLIGILFFAGIGFSYALDTIVTYDVYRSIWLARLCGSFSLIMLLYTIAKIFEVQKVMADNSEAKK